MGLKRKGQGTRNATAGLVGFRYFVVYKCWALGAGTYSSTAVSISASWAAYVDYVAAYFYVQAGQQVRFLVYRPGGLGQREVQQSGDHSLSFYQFTRDTWRLLTCSLRSVLYTTFKWDDSTIMQRQLPLKIPTYYLSSKYLGWHYTREVSR
jgi:hypothetical protein